jgi:hypothetical protein
MFQIDRVAYEKPIIQDVLNLHKNKELNLNPWYQKRSAWTPPQTAYLINTLFENKPRIDKIYQEYDGEFPHESLLEKRFDKVFSHIASLKDNAIHDMISKRFPLGKFEIELLITMYSLENSTTKLCDDIMEHI